MSEPRWLSSEEMAAWLPLVQLVTLLPQALDRQLREEAGLPHVHYQVLAVLSDAPDQALRMSELARRTATSLSRLSHAISRLERSGWVQRRSCSDGGGRRTEARLTDAGIAKLEQIAPGHVSEARRLVVDVLTAEQLAALGEAARAITAATMAAAPEACREVGGC